MNFEWNSLKPIISRGLQGPGPASRPRRSSLPGTCASSVPRVGDQDDVGCRTTTLSSERRASAIFATVTKNDDTCKCLKKTAKISFREMKWLSGLKNLRHSLPLEFHGNEQPGTRCLCGFICQTVSSHTVSSGGWVSQPTVIRAGTASRPGRGRGAFSKFKCWIYVWILLVMGTPKPSTGWVVDQEISFQLVKHSKLWKKVIYRAVCLVVANTKSVIWSKFCYSVTVFTAFDPFCVLWSLGRIYNFLKCEKNQSAKMSNKTHSHSIDQDSVFNMASW